MATLPNNLEPESGIGFILLEDGVTALRLEPTIVPAQYRLLSPHYIMNVQYDSLAIVNEGKEVPNSWVPSLEVDPLNATAVTAFYNAGPRSFNAQCARMNYHNLTASQPNPVTFWKFTPPNSFTLSGLGASLAAVHQ